jgi:hypothetical protein
MVPGTERRSVWTARGRRWLAAFAPVASIAGAMLATDARAAQIMYATVSGIPATPMSERAVRPRDGVGIRFRAPGTVRVASIWTHWRSAADGCTVDLRADASGVPGDVLAAAVPLTGGGWRGADVDVPLVAGELYHVVVACGAASRSRLTYVLDAARTDDGTWLLQDLGRAYPRRRSPRAMPLFALRFSDDTWWGQPYRGDARRPQARLCGSDQLRQTIVMAQPMTLTAVRLPVQGESVTLQYDVAALSDGGGAASGPTLLEAGAPYRLRLRAAKGGCARRATLVTDLPIGRPYVGLEARGLEASSDRGETWRPLEGALGIALTVSAVPSPPAEPHCGDGVRAGAEHCDGTADAACPGRCTATCDCAPLPSCGDGGVNGEEECDGASDTACPGRCSQSCTCTPPPPVCGDGVVTGHETCDGASDAACPGRCTHVCMCSPLPSVCGDGVVNGNDECDGGSDAACPGRCTASCTCRVPPACGDGVLNGGEACDGASDAACPGRCAADCTCTSPPPPPTRSYKSIYGSGYLGVYDAATYSLWPSRLSLILGGADVQGPKIASAKQQAAAAGNTDAIFAFYLSLTDMDSRCGCLDQRLYDGFRNSHPEWILRNSGGGMVSTNNGIGRLFATDIGNLAYIDHWADFALAEAERHGWDGVWADNVFRGYFGEWSAAPINPRTRKAYTTREYRDDMLRALKRLRERFHARGKLLIGNHTQTWQPDVFADPVQREAITTMDGVEIEDCVFSYGGSRAYDENQVLAQLKYLDYANKNGIMTICRAFTTSSREYPLAFYLLTKEAMSQIAQLNGAGQWKSDMTTDLGAPAGGFYCLDPSNGYQKTSDCPSPGKILGRDWTKGRALVNPSASATRTVPLGGTFRRNGSSVTSVTLGPRAGAILLR